MVFLFFLHRAVPGRSREEAGREDEWLALIWIFKLFITREDSDPRHARGTRGSWVEGECSHVWILIVCCYRLRGTRKIHRDNCRFWWTYLFCFSNESKSFMWILRKESLVNIKLSVLVIIIYLLLLYPESSCLVSYSPHCTGTVKHL